MTNGQRPNGRWLLVHAPMAHGPRTLDHDPIEVPNPIPTLNSREDPYPLFLKRGPTTLG